MLFPSAALLSFSKALEIVGLLFFQNEKGLPLLFLLGIIVSIGSATSSCATSYVSIAALETGSGVSGTYESFIFASSLGEWASLSSVA